MGALTDYAENHILDWLLRGQTLTPPSTMYIGLLTSLSNAESGGQTEVSGGSYARVAVASSLANWAGTQGAASTSASSGSDGTTSINQAEAFPKATADWGSVVGFGLFDAATGGNMWIYAALTTSQTISAGATASFAAGALSVQIDS